MELFRNIFFNTDKVIENTEIKVTYAGKLFQNGSEDVMVHYGFGENWEDAQDLQMQKSELGFQADIFVKPNTKLNFCFKNSTGEWDNNDGSNYAFKIEKTNWQEENIENIKNNESNNIENVINKNSVTSVTQTQSQSQVTSLCSVTSSWGALLKKTFNNLAKFISKLFSGNKEKANNNN